MDAYHGVAGGPLFQGRAAMLDRWLYRGPLRPWEERAVAAGVAVWGLVWLAYLIASLV